MEVIIGYIAAFVTSSAHLPQLVHVLRRRCAKDLSYSWLIVHVTGASCWFIYGLLTQHQPLMISGSCVAVSLSILSFLKIYYERKEKTR